jgi:hypothetical protein
MQAALQWSDLEDILIDEEDAAASFGVVQRERRAVVVESGAHDRYNRDRPA